MGPGERVCLKALVVRKRAKRCDAALAGSRGMMCSKLRDLRRNAQTCNKPLEEGRVPRRRCHASDNAVASSACPSCHDYDTTARLRLRRPRERKFPRTAPVSAAIAAFWLGEARLGELFARSGMERGRGRGRGRGQRRGSTASSKTLESQYASQPPAPDRLTQPASGECASETLQCCASTWARAVTGAALAEGETYCRSKPRLLYSAGWVGAHNTTVHGCYLDKNEAGLGWAGPRPAMQCLAILRRHFETHVAHAQAGRSRGSYSDNIRRSERNERDNGRTGRRLPT